MKRILLATLLLLLAGGGFCALHVKAGRARRQLQSDQGDWQTRTQRLAELEITRTTLTEQVRDLKREVRGLESNVTGERPWMLSLLNTNNLAGLAPALREQLLAELGLSWHTSDQWLLVSKDTLAKVRTGAIQRNKLTDAACGVLAITPDERQRLDAAFARVREQHSDWAKANVQREGPSGEVLARYTIPSDTVFAQGLTNDLYGTFAATLGPERAGLLENYASDWVGFETSSLGGATNRLTLLRKTDSAGTTQLMYALERGTLGQGASAIRPDSYFPSEFRTVFPGGWPEVAQREGFELPEGFQNRPTGDTRSRIEAVFPQRSPKP